MKPQPLYPDSNMNPYTASQMQHSSAHRMQQRAGVNSFSGRPGSYSAEAQHSHKSSKVEGQWQWQWDRDVQNVSSQIPSHAFNEGQGANVTRSYYQGQTADHKAGFESQAKKEVRTQPHEQEMDIGYEDNALPLTFEGLEQKFLDDIMKLAKEQSDEEDTENTRHKEKIIEINTRYQEKLSALRAQQSNRREEFLSKESQARLSQYQQARLNHYPNTGLQDARGYSSAVVAGAPGEPHRAYGSNQFESYRDRPQFAGAGRTQATQGRVPYSEGRAYNSMGARYYW